MNSRLLRPYASTTTNREEKAFNYRLSRAKRITENAFSMLTSRFRIFNIPLDTSYNTCNKIVLAAVVLHNMLLSNNLKKKGKAGPEASSCTEDMEGCRLDGVQGASNVTRSSALEARKMRDALKGYFSNDYSFER